MIYKWQRSLDVPYYQKGYYEYHMIKRLRSTGPKIYSYVTLIYSKMFHFDLSGPLSLDDFYGDQTEKILTLRRDDDKYRSRDGRRGSALSGLCGLQFHCSDPKSQLWIWVWVNTYENTIFTGMNIHKSQL